MSQLRASLASSTSKFFDCDRSLDAENSAPIVKPSSGSDCLLSAWIGNAQVTRSSETQSKKKLESRVTRDLELPEVKNGNVESNNQATDDVGDTVSGLQSDNLQKEVILVKKASHEEDQNLEDKHDRVEVCDFCFLRGFTKKTLEGFFLDIRFVFCVLFVSPHC